MRGTGALARASMADLKPDRVRAAELAQTGAGRGRARGEQAEREHESTRTLLEHDPYIVTGGPMAGRSAENDGGCVRMMVNASVVLGSSERESDDSVSVGIPILCENLCTGSCSEIVFVETATKLGKGGKKKSARAVGFALK